MEASKVLPRSMPEDQGVSSEAILSFIQEVEKNGLALHGFMLLRHDHVIAEGWWKPYRPEYPHLAFSLTKSFTSTAVGLAVQEGLISVEDYVADHFPEFATDAIRENMGSLQIKHLLTMSTGHVLDTARRGVKPRFLHLDAELSVGDRPDGDWAHGFLELPIEREPGTHFLYNSGASHMLSAIVEKVTGQHLIDYLYPRLFAPLGIARPHWDTSPLGANTGGWGLKLRTEDIARFGQLLLRQGVWDGQRLVPEEWLKDATRKRMHTVNPDAAEASKGNVDWEQGYGYQFWMCTHDAYRGDGAFGQYCLVMPGQDAVLAINSGLGDMQAVLTLVWQRLFPALSDDAGKTSKESAESAQAELRQKLASLAMSGPSGGLPAGKSGTQRYLLDSNAEQVQEVRFLFEEKGFTLTWIDEAGEQSVACGYDDWNADNALGDEQAAAKAAWLDADTLVVDLVRVQTPFRDRLTCKFAGGAVELKIEHPYIPVERLLTGQASQ